MADLGTAVNEAVASAPSSSLTATAAAESISTRATTPSTTTTPASRSPPVRVTTATGRLYPAASRYVTAVGGTSLTTASNARGWTESAGAAPPVRAPAQGVPPMTPSHLAEGHSGARNRTVTDVAADADPATGVAVYDNYVRTAGWRLGRHQRLLAAHRRGLRPGRAARGLAPIPRRTSTGTPPACMTSPRAGTPSFVSPTCVAPGPVTTGRPGGAPRMASPRSRLRRRSCSSRGRSRTRPRGGPR